jgi:hypothetical protein
MQMTIKMTFKMTIQNSFQRLVAAVTALSFSAATMALEPVQESEVHSVERTDVYKVAVLVEFNGTNAQVVKIAELNKIKNYRPFSADNQITEGVVTTSPKSVVSAKEIKQPPKGKILVTWNGGAKLIVDPRIVRAPFSGNELGQSDGLGHGKVTYTNSGSFIVHLTSRQTNLDKKQLMSSLSIVWPDLPALEI